MCYFIAEMFLRQVGPYQFYVLLIFLITYLLNQLDRYMLPITVKPMAQELHFGDKGCMIMSNYTESDLGSVKCDALHQQKLVYFYTPILGWWVETPMVRVGGNTHGG